MSTLERQFVLVHCAAVLMLFGFVGCCDDKPVEPTYSGWEQQASGVSTTLVDVCFVDSLVGWVLGHGGTVLHTEDGGESWRSQDFGDGAAASLTFVDSEYGWIVGGGGKIYRTANGGNDWETQNSQTTLSLFSVAFLNRDTGWVAGDLGIVLRTVDGGLHWQEQQAPGWDGQLRSIGITPQRGIWAYGPMSDTVTVGILLQSDDYGEHWAVSFGPGGWPVDAAFASLNVGWVVNELSFVMQTIDRGQSWTPVAQVPLRPYSLNLQGSHAWVVGCQRFPSSELGGTPLIVATGDGGMSWRTQLTGSASDTLMCVRFMGINSGWAVGSGGAIWHTNTAGD